MKIVKHFATFMSPGTFVDEETTREIDLPNPCLAVQVSATIRERYGATPYGFVLFTREHDQVERAGKVFKTDPVETYRSGVHFIGGDVLTLEDIPDTPDNRILRANMKGNDIERVIENKNSWRSVKPFNVGDKVVGQNGEVLAQ